MHRLRRMALVVPLAALAVPFFWRLDAEEFHGDESHWISSGQQAFFLVSHGRLQDPQWRDEFYFYSQPQVGKLLIGAAQAVAGIAGPTPIYDYDWQLRPWQNAAAGRVPSPRAILAGRVPGAVAGWLACLLLWDMARRLGAPRAGLLAAVLLATHPLWLANSRRAGLDATALALGLAASAAALRATTARLWPAGAWWLAAGALAGLAAADKYVALLSLPLGGALVAATAGVARLRSVVAGVVVAGAVAAATFWASNPALYEHPWHQLQISVDFLATQADDMRRDSPVFQSPSLVAAEIVDRAIWPTGVPEVVDHTLPEVLAPGSYGTPIVALGLLVAAVVALAERRRPWPGRQLAGAAAAWLAVVFVLLTLSVPTWWERWHLPLIPPLCLVAGTGLAALDGLTRRAWRVARLEALNALEAGSVLAGAQALGALAMLPSYLGRGFGALVDTPAGAAAHLGGLAWTLTTLVSQCRRQWVAARIARVTAPASQGVLHGSEEVRPGGE